MRLHGDVLLLRHDFFKELVRRQSIVWRAVLISVLGVFNVAAAQAQESLPTSEGNRNMGHLVIVGGGLRPDNRGVFEKIVELAGGPERANFVIIPAASIDIAGSQEFARKLELYGVPPQRVQVLNVMEHNAAVATHDPEILAKVREASAVYLSGGDQRRLVRLLKASDGSDTPLLGEIRKLFARGGLIAGSSAGASAQSEHMLAVSGLPDYLIDEGLDTLDYGITADVLHRGLLLTSGFGFFQAGIIDQHFFQFRGRLGRLTRATDESGLRYGFGIDENTALVVQSNGRLRVMGQGFVSIVQPSAMRGKDGPLGYQISDVTLSLLSNGDEFDLEKGAVFVAEQKLPLPADKLEYNGNFLINDISAGSEAPFALINGLADNRRNVQEGIAIKFHGDTSHGYRFTFSKRADTQAFAGLVEHVTLYSLTNVRLDISPIANGLKSSAEHVPTDLPEGQERSALSAVAFRGLLPANRAGEFRPQAALTRGEFAIALARSAHLVAAPPLAQLADVDVRTLEGDEILRAVAAGFFLTDVGAGNHFKPADALAPTTAASALEKLARMSNTQVQAALLEDIAALKDNGRTDVSRGEIGLLLHRILKLPK